MFVGALDRMLFNHPYSRQKPPMVGWQLLLENDQLPHQLVCCLNILNGTIYWVGLPLGIIGHDTTLINGRCNWNIIFPPNRFQGWINQCLLTTKHISLRDFTLYCVRLVPSCTCQIYGTVGLSITYMCFDNPHATIHVINKN
jgi:hypothetical protein